MIRKAEPRDVQGIIKIVADTIVLMHAEGNVQWSSDYPRDSDFLQDIGRGTLHVLELQEEIAGFICVDGNEPAEYAALDWQAAEGEAAVIHRMSLAVKHRRQGWGSALFQYAETLARSEGKSFIKTDTYSLNPKMNKLFLSNGYKKTGCIYFKGRPLPFYCYEKPLN